MIMKRRELLVKRDEELWEAYLRKAHALGPVIQECSITNVLKAINDMGCSRYWIEYDRARVVLECMKKGRNPYRQPMRRKMCVDLYERYKELKKEYPSMMVSNLVERAIKSPAKSFYLDNRTISNIIFNNKK